MKTPARSISQDSCEENEIPEVALGPGLLTQSAFSGGGVGGGGWPLHCSVPGLRKGQDGFGGLHAPSTASFME